MCESQINPVYRRLKSVVEAKSRAKAEEVTA
jgi:hypothetical protein